MQDDDVLSVFRYDQDGDPEEEVCRTSYSLSALTLEANKLFSPQKCVLFKIGEGGFHKVYDVKTSEGEETGFVARVANPAFPKDKLESEVATMKYIAEKTTVPVPKVLSWCSDASNPVGAEYMFISKVPGVPADEVWPKLPLDAKKNMVRQLAECLCKLWELRFDSMGSLYLSPDGAGYTVGPIIDTHFHQADNKTGQLRVKEPIDLSEFRGPFSSVSSLLASGPKAELKLYAERREDLVVEAMGKAEHVESGHIAMEKALPLCDVYPGESPISNDVKEPISLCLDDYRLSNFMINPETGDLNALIDFESATAAPGWLCAHIPYWLESEESIFADYDARMYRAPMQVEHREDAKPSEHAIETAILHEEFMQAIRSSNADGTLIKAYQAGRPYREFAVELKYNISVWHGWEYWVDSMLRWTREHPGVPAPSDVDDIYPDLQPPRPRAADSKDT
ncbi:hypothetical protein SCHPADRAFT_907227 [Schizopora paradoxa]|uniref:Aminoglycoside phosphotransferase domain-containing protein n=1 Tax=Schizopora paradoxa TaxID=27342 RepID=A0A0H2RER7_9AGAM|nr:hypothetical protein SCHPADRAFT_907227 [Schizopora paradoxa]